jgi:hypothetical protein
MVTAEGYAARLQMDAGNASSWPYIVDWYANPATYMNAYEPGAIAAGVTQDQKIAAEDAGKGSVAIASISTADLQYASSVTGAAFPQFLASYTSDSHDSMDQTIGAYSAGGYIGFPQGVVLTGSPAIQAAVAAFQAASAVPSHAKP